MSGTARAERALFLLHYKRVLFPVAVVYFGLLGAVVAALYIVGRYQSWSEKQMTDLAQGMDIMALIFGVGFSLPVGTAVFSRAFKEQQILFFHTLPVSRTRQWIIFTSSSAAALLTTYVLAGVFRPGAVRLLLREPAATLLVAGIAILGYAAGSCFALVFTRAVAVYTTAFIVPYLFLIGAGLLMLQPYNLIVGPKSHSAVFLLEDQPLIQNILPAGLIVAIVASFIVAFFACSLFFYLRGELVTLRTQLRNFGIVLAIGVSIAVGVTLTGLAIVSRRAPWSSGGWNIDVAPSGRFGVQLLRASAYPWRAQLRFVDFDSGRTVRVDAVGATSEFATNDATAVALRDMSILPHTRGDRVVVYDMSGKPLRDVRFAGEEIMHVTAAADGRIVVLTTDGARAHIYQMSRSSDPRELARAAVDPLPKWWMTPSTVLIMNRIEENRAWTLEDGVATEIPWAKATTKQPMPVIYRGVAYPDRDAVVRQIEKETPLPRDPGDAIDYYIPSILISRDSISTLYAMRANVARHTASVYLLPPHEKTWQLITSAVPLLRDDNFNAQPTFTDHFSMLAGVDRYQRLFYVDASTAKPTVRLFDPAVNRSIDVLTMQDVDPRLNLVSFGRLGNISILSVQVRTDDVNRSINKGLWLYDGKLVPMPNVHPRGYFILRRDDGSLVYASDRGATIVAPNGTTREVRVANR